MRAQDIDSLAAWPAHGTVGPSGTYVAAGYGLRIAVWRGHLRVADGIGRDRRDVILHRATSGLRRLVVIGHTGSISFDAIRWLADVGASYLQLDEDHRVLAAFGPQGTDRPSLRRAQVMAFGSASGMAIGRDLLRGKLLAQATTLDRLATVLPVEPDLAQGIQNLARALEVADDVTQLRSIEARAAAAYWGAWSSLPVHFARRDEAIVPTHWRTFGTRSSPLTGGPRLATNPGMALLNYLYALLEAEATIAARIVSLDPGLGIIHADQLNRDSLAADLMEPVRPAVDAYVLELITARTFAARDFYETREGVCRITPTLGRELALTCRRWGLLVGRVAENVARAIEPGTALGRSSPTPVTGRNRSLGRGPTSRHRAERGRPQMVVADRCVECGAAVEPGRRTCSDGCLAATRIAVGRAEMPAEARQKVARRSVSTIEQAREWQRTHPWPTDLAMFEQEILPRLADVPIGELVAATGLSKAYLRRVRQGTATPHPMWWDRLREAIVERPV
jgi:CRISPR-associated endonuclease Cas1